MLLKAEKLVKTYNKKNVVNGITIEVNKGEIVGLLGPNGAGKTTTFYMILGLVKPNCGQIFFNGKNITNEPVYKRARAGLGYLAQEPSIFRKLTVEENVMAILETLDLTKAERKERLTKLLDDLKITKLAKQKAFTLVLILMAIFQLQTAQDPEELNGNTLYQLMLLVNRLKNGESDIRNVLITMGSHLRAETVLQN